MYDKRYVDTFLDNKNSNFRLDFEYLSQYFDYTYDIEICRKVFKEQFSERVIALLPPTLSLITFIVIKPGSIYTKSLSLDYFQSEYRRLRLEELLKSHST